ncbi:MAG: hypothetical protein JRI59_07445, partial [Deltaproteobacteria bacterium]|nr:hypothetical protein [Deltaproteobacteria bacterium]
SAGLSPLGWVVPETLQVLEERGLPLDGLHSKGLEEVDASGFRLIVNLTARPVDFYLPADCRARVMNRPVPDPYGGGLDLYRQTRDAIEDLILTDIRAFFSGG